MAYFRVSVKGTIGPTEVWSVNPAYDPAWDTGVTWDQEQADLITLAMASVTVPTALINLMGSTTRITSYRLELRQDGTDELLGVSERQLGTPIAGGSSVSKPPQTAVVASLRTNTPGASGRGRLYWPATGAAIDTDTYRVPTTIANAAAAGFSSYLDALAEAIMSVGGWAPWTQMQLVVRSKTRGTTYPVTRIMVGNTFDTQRRRRDALAEVYSSAVYPPA